MYRGVQLKWWSGRARIKNLGTFVPWHLQTSRLDLLSPCVRPDVSLHNKIVEKQEVNIPSRTAVRGVAVGLRDASTGSVGAFIRAHAGNWSAQTNDQPALPSDTQKEDLMHAVHKRLWSHTKLIKKTLSRDDYNLRQALYSGKLELVKSATRAAAVTSAIEGNYGDSLTGAAGGEDARSGRVHHRRALEVTAPGRGGGVTEGGTRTLDPATRCAGEGRCPIA